MIMPNVMALKKQPTYYLTFDAYSQSAEGQKEELPHFVSDWFAVDNVTAEAMEQFKDVFAGTPKPTKWIRLAFPTDLTAFAIYVELKAEDGEVMRKLLITFMAEEEVVCK